MAADLRRIERRLLKLALSYPEAWEDHPWGENVVKVGKKIFVFLGDLIYEWTDDAADFGARPVAETLDEYRSLYRRTRAPRAEASIRPP